MTTLQNIQMKLACSRSGRMALHLICLCHDRKLRWHACGIGRELCQAAKQLGRALESLPHYLNRVADIPTAASTVSAIHDTVLIRRHLNGPA
jgi:hypothetical protein